MKKISKVGFIGFGRMGSVLGGALIASKAVRPRQLFVFDPRAAARNATRGIVRAKDEQEVMKHSDVLFICVRPLDIVPVAKKLTVRKGVVIISVAAGVSLSTLQRYFGGNVIRIIPGFTQRIGAGPILYAINKKVSPSAVKTALTLLRTIGEPEEIPESLLEVATDLTSCAPAFWAYLLDTFIGEATRRGMKHGTARRISSSAMLASARILLDEPKLMDVVDCVATPGGITREGITVLEREFPNTVRRIFDATEKKYRSLHKALQR